MSAEVELRMLKGSEFQTVGAAMLKKQMVMQLSKRISIVLQ